MGESSKGNASMGVFGYNSSQGSPLRKVGLRSDGIGVASWWWSLWYTGILGSDTLKHGKENLGGGSFGSVVDVQGDLVLACAGGRVTSV